MRQETINICTFNELSDEAKEKAREWYRDGDSEMTSDQFEYRLEELGLPNKDIRWSLSCCQGDGVAFYGELDIEEYLTKNKLKTKFKKLFDNDKDIAPFL